MYINIIKINFFTHLNQIKIGIIRNSNPCYYDYLLTGLKNRQPEDEVIFELELLESTDFVVLYSGALASAMHTRSGNGYKFKECDASGQYVGHTSRGTVIRCDWLSNVLIYYTYNYQWHQ